MNRAVVKFETYQNQLPPELKLALEKYFSGLDNSVLSTAREIITAEPAPTALQLKILLEFIRTGRPVLLNSPAGTGKTTVLVKTALLELLNSHRPNPLFLLPTRRAVNLIEGKLNSYASCFRGEKRRALRGRYRQLFSASDFQAGVSTLHSFCFRFLQSIDRKLLIRAQLRFIDGSTLLLPYEATRLSREICDSAGQQLYPWKSTVYRRRTGFYRERMLSPAEVRAAAVSDSDYEAACFYRLYQDKKRQLCLLDFDDLIFFVVKLLRREQTLRDRLNKTINCCFVDQLSRTNRLTMTLLSHLTAGGEGLMAAADSFISASSSKKARAARRELFRLLYPQGRIYSIRTNHRTRALLAFALAEIAVEDNAAAEQTEPASRRRRRQGRLDYGYGPAVFEAKNAQEETDFIRHKILRLLAGECEPAEILVVLPGGPYLRELETVLQEYFPVSSDFQKTGWEQPVTAAVRNCLLLADRIDGRGTAGLDEPCVSLLRLFLKKSEVAEVKRLTGDGAAVAELIVRRRRLAALKRSTRATVERIAELLERLQDPALYRSPRRLNRALNRPFNLLAGRASRRQRSFVRRQLKKLIGIKRPVGPGQLLRAIDSRRIETGAFGKAEKRRGIRLATPRRVQGEEYEVVFIPGFEEAIWPGSRPGPESADCLLDRTREEFYLAATRAREELFISYSLRRWKDGRHQSRQRSKLLDCFSPEYLDYRRARLNWLTRINRWLERLRRWE